jgi:hypothetical protein
MYIDVEVPLEAVAVNLDTGVTSHVLSLGG